MNHERVIRAKQVQLLWTGGIAALVLVLSAIGAWQLSNQQADLEHQLELVEMNAATNAGVTLNGCQRGNELRRAVAMIAAEQASRTRNVKEANRPGIDPDATSITPCRRVVTIVTGRDPGPVPNFVEAP